MEQRSCKVCSRPYVFHPGGTERDPDFCDLCMKSLGSSSYVHRFLLRRIEDLEKRVGKPEIKEKENCRNCNGAKKAWGGSSWIPCPFCAEKE